MLYLLTLQSLIAALVFSLRKPRHISNYILSFWFIINALNFIGILIPGGLSSYIKIGYLPFLFLNGPVFLFYVLSQIKIDFRFRRIHALHLLPFLFVSIYRLITISESVQPSFFYKAEMPLKHLIIYSLICLSVIIYLAVIFVLLLRHKKNIANYFSSKSRRFTLDWVIVVLIIFAVSNILEYFAPLVPGLQNLGGDSTFWFNQFNLGMLGFLLLVFGLLQPAIYVDKPVNMEERKEEASKYIRSGLSKQQLSDIGQTIHQYIETQKPYLNPEYNLELMAKDLNITRQNLSQAINDEIGKNFYQLINEFRVTEFKRYLNDPKMNHITFLGLAYEAGFNSKSSFYRVFKEITGETPTEFRQKIKRDDPQAP
jgi:AraC-like DNA-binding protein